MSEYTNILNEYNERLNNVSNNIANTMNIANNLPEYLDTSDATATANDIVLGQTAYVNGVKLTGTYEGQTINNQDKVIAPSTSIQNIIADSGYTGLNQVTINAVNASIDANIVQANIRSGVTILGVEGTVEPLEYNIYTQTTEPTPKKGLWLQKEFNYSNIITTDEVNTEPPAWNTTKMSELRAIPYAFRSGGAVVMNTDIYLFGGEDDQSYKNFAYKYDTLTDTYTQLANVPYRFTSGPVVLVGTDIYLFGGMNGNQLAYKYNTLTDTYTKLTNIPYQFVDGSAVAINTDIYLLGSSLNAYRQYAYKYDTLTNTYTRLTNIPYEFFYGSAVSIGTDIYLFGTGYSSYKQYAYKYNTLTNIYTQLTNIPYSFYKGSATVAGADIYLFGGYGDKIATYKYSALTDIYTQLTNIPYDFVNGQAVNTEKDIYLLGGSDYPTKVQVYTIANYPDNSLIIENGNDYTTELMPTNVINGIPFKFKNFYPYTISGGLDQYNTKRYYGNGVNWIDITPQVVKIAGIHADFINNQFTRIEDSQNWSAGSDFDDFGPYQRYRCILTDSGIELAQYGETGYTETGFLEQAITKDGITYPIGTEVQVMVRQPKVWYKIDNVVLDTSDNVSINSCDYLVADGPAEGFSLHPAFTMNNQEIDRLYYPAFEGTLYDDSSTSYTGGSTSTIDYSNDKLSSVKADGTLTPRISITRANTRTLASNRGSAWSQLTIQMVELERLLMTIEYASFNHQSVLSYGVTDSSEVVAVGRVTTFNSSGTGLAGEYIATSDSFTWRWHENIYGNVWKWNDGVNVINRLFYVADHNFVDDTTTGYTSTGITIVSTNDYISKFGYNQDCDWVFIPTQSNGTETQPVGDYCFSDSGNKIVHSGGVWFDTSIAGSFDVLANRDSSYFDFAIGAALAARFIDS